MVGGVFPMFSVWALLFWVLVGALLAVSFFRARSGIRSRADRPLDDEDIRRILETGSLSRGERLDLDEIEAEERRFWQEEEWDEAEEW